FFIVIVTFPRKSRRSSWLRAAVMPKNVVRSGASRAESTAAAAAQGDRAKGQTAGEQREGGGLGNRRADNDLTVERVAGGEDVAVVGAQVVEVVGALAEHIDADGERGDGDAVREVDERTGGDGERRGGGDQIIRELQGSAGERKASGEIR